VSDAFLNSTKQPLSAEQLKRIDSPLTQSLNPSSPLHILRRFPGGLMNLSDALKLHLEVIRSIAKRFRMLSMETFTYYFAQYYAQDAYRGSFVKLAPESERDFDEPFD